MNTNLIHQYCKVIKEIHEPVHAIFYFDCGFGYAEIETEDGVESYSCDTEEMFDDFVRWSVDA